MTKKAKALFLDRDGVINHEKSGSYIFNEQEFKFYEGAVQAIVKASQIFDYVIVVTNQRGIGRGLMSVADLESIHQFMVKEVELAGGKIDSIYYAPASDRSHYLRKPNVGMGLQAQKDYPEIDFEGSVMIGNNISDMQFGKTLGMKTVFLYTTQAKIDTPHPLIDEQFESLKKWSEQDIVLTPK